MDDLPPTFSVSQLTTYLGCPRKYRFRYVEHREPEERSAELALGSAVHSAIAWWMDERRAGKSPTDEAMVKLFGVDWFAQLAANEYAFEEKTPDEYRGQGELLVLLFLARFRDEPPLESERRFEVPIVDPRTGEVLDLPLVGYLDLVGDDVVGEIKTTARTSGIETWLLQLTAYSYAHREATGVRPRVRVIQLVKTKVPKVEVEETTFTDRQEAWFLEVACEAIAGMRAGAFFPNPSWMCPRCEYRKACRG